MRAVHLGLLACVCSGCQDELPPASLLDRDRALGARIEVSGDPDQGWPAPGQEAIVRWIMHAPSPVTERAWRFVVCPTVRRADGAPDICTAAPYVTLEGRGLEPVISFAVADGEVLGDTRRLAINGVICTEGTVSEDIESGGCAEPTATPHLVSVGVELALSESNRNPTLADNKVLFDGAEWLATASSLPERCEDAADIFKVTPGDEHTIGLTTDRADRDTFVRLEGDPPIEVMRTESLQLSRFASAGELDRQFGVVEPDDARAETLLETTWTAPPVADVPEGGRVVRFVFVIRDLRGGLDAVSRELCVTSH